MAKNNDHANCAPGCHLHPEVHHAGWIQGGTGRWHYFMPGMKKSECGRLMASDSAVRYPEAEIASRECANCIRSVASYAIKLRGALDSDETEVE